MRGVHYSLDVKKAVANGDAFPTADLTEKWVHITGTFVATLDIEGSMDGTNWIAFATEAAPALVEIPATFKKMRISTTAYVSGTPLAALGALDARTD